jgi:hypothetical protein
MVKLAGGPEALTPRNWRLSAIPAIKIPSTPVSDGSVCFQTTVLIAFSLVSTGAFWRSTKIFFLYPALCRQAVTLPR